MKIVEKGNAIGDIKLFIARRLLGPRSGELGVNGELLFDLLNEAKRLFQKGEALPPLLLLEIFILMARRKWPDLSGMGGTAGCLGGT